MPGRFYGSTRSRRAGRCSSIAADHRALAASNRPLDLQIQQKILPKFAGNRAKLEQPLWELLWYLYRSEREVPLLTAAELDAIDPQEASFPESVSALRHMLKTLRQVGFASFIE